MDADVGPDLLEVETQVGHLVAIDDDLRLGLIDLDVDDRRKGKHTALHRFELDLLGKLQDLVRLGRRGEDELHRELAAARAAPAAVTGSIRMPGMACSFRCTSGRILKDGTLALVPGLDHHAGKAGGRMGQLEGELGLRHAEIDPVDRRGIAAGLVEGGIGRRIDDAENDALVLGGRQFLGRHDEHGDGQQAHHDPHHVDGRTGVEGDVEQAAVEAPEAV